MPDQPKLWSLCDMPATGLDLCSLISLFLAMCQQVEGKLELQGVVFAYPVRPETRIFNGFNLVVPAGKTVALVGSSGSGKSTVVQLIERFYGKWRSCICPLCLPCRE